MMNKTLTGIAVGASLIIGGRTVIPVLTATTYDGCDLQSAEVIDLASDLQTYKIRESLLSVRPLDAKEKADFKACEIAKKTFSTVYTKDEYMLEIVGDIEKIDGGVQVFARAWKNGSQLGFGADGTVDIERFRVFNPPILVPDPKGDIVQTSYIELLKTTETRTLREDPIEALMQALVRTASIHGVNGKNIIPGKIGKTTDTFYSSSDGYAGRNDSSYALVRSAVGDIGSNSAAILAIQNGVNAGTYTIYRSLVMFDTSALPDTDDISASTLSITTSAFSNADSDGTLVDVSNPANPASIAASDYDITKWSGVAQSNTILHSTLSVAGVSSFTINATGISNISKTGTTKFGLRSSNDFNNTAPTGNPYHYPFSTDQVGTTQDPVLSVTHAAGGGGGAPAPRIIEPIITWW